MREIYEGLLLEAMEENTHGVKSREQTFPGGKITTVQLAAQNPFDRPEWTYVTVELSPVQRLQDEALETAVAQIAAVLEKFVVGRRVLVAALGNNEITPDSLGPKMLRHLMITRPLALLQPQTFADSGLRSVAAVCTNVFGTTGVESAELIAGLCAQVEVDAVVVIDALATTHLSRLCTTVQLSDGGLSPGAGVGNHRKLLNAQTLGVPVISVGMPTVMDGGALAQALCQETESPQELLQDYDGSLIVTPADIGVATDNGAKLLAFSLNRALHGLSIAEMLQFLS